VLTSYTVAQGHNSIRKALDSEQSMQYYIKHIVLQPVRGQSALGWFINNNKLQNGGWNS